MIEIKAKYPIRINRYLSLKNYATRKGADRLVEQGLVTINGRIAVLGDKVQENDKVEVNEELRTEIKHRTYLAYNKPAGIVTSLPQGDEQGIEDVISFHKKVFPIGRLDKDSRGLIILTDDGRITDKLLNPKYIHEKEYIAQVHKEITPDFLKKMETGVKLDDDYVTQPCEVRRMTKNKFKIIITEGKKRQIRRMCLALGYEVVNLCRTRIMNIQLSDIPEGDFRKIKGKMLEVFLNNLGMI